MSTSTLGLFLRQLALSAEVRRLGTDSDHNLLAAYELRHSQAAFTELMRRHGPMVLRTCRRLLGHGPDAEDAFQATFVLLACKVGQLRREVRSLGGWLHHVAYQTARQVLRGAVRRREHERQVSVMTHSHRDPSTEAAWDEIEPILDAELDSLPEEARLLLIAFYLEEKTYSEVAAELGLPRGSLVRRLEKARALLAVRLARRGITVSASLLAVLLGASAKGAVVPAVLLVHTVEAARTFTEQATGIVSDTVVRLVKGGLAQMTKGWTHWSMALMGWVGLLGAGLIACQTLKAWPEQNPENEPPAAPLVERPAQEREKPSRTDCFGDPLPPGAIARMGTVRLWSGGARYNPGATLVFSPDGKVLASRDGDKTICFWDATTGKEIRRFTTMDAIKGAIAVLTFSPDGQTLVTVDSWDKTVCFWEVATGKFLRKQAQGTERERNEVRCGITFLPDGRILGVRDFLLSPNDNRGVAGEREMYVWDVAAGKKIRRLNGSMKREILNTAVFSPDGKLLATVAMGDKSISLWNVATGKQIRELTPSDGQPGRDCSAYALAFSPDGKTLVAADSQNDPNAHNVGVWDVATGKYRHLFTEEWSGFAPTLVFSPDGKTLLAGGKGRLWDVRTGKEIHSLGLEHLGAAAAFSLDGKILAVEDKEGAIRLWEVATGKEIGPRHGHGGLIWTIVYSPDGKTLASMSDDETVRLWEVATGKAIRPLAKHEGRGSGHIEYSPDGKLLVSMERNLLHLWDAATGKEIRQFKIENGHFRSATFSPDGKKLAAYGESMLHLWDIATEETYTLPTEFDRLTWNFCPVVFSPDGRMLAAPGKDNTVGLWEVATGKPVGQLSGPKSQKDDRSSVCHLAFSPDSGMLATSSTEDDKIRLWEVPSGKEIRQLSGKPIQFNLNGWPLAFSPDGRMLATIRSTTGVDEEIHLWEVATGKETGQLNGHRAVIRAIAFSPDGKTLASGSDDLTCLIWDVSSFMRQLKPAAARPLARQPLSQKQLEAAWTDLGSDDPAKAYRAVSVLQAAPKQAMPLLQARVRPVAPLADPQRLTRLIADLDGSNFKVREKAQQEIVQMGEPAIPVLQRALADRPPLEVKRRLQDLLATLEPKLITTSTLRLLELRSVQVLESMATAESRKLLQDLAKGVSGASLTRDAQAALKRLDKRSTPRP